jgi:hypothetical protein
LEKSGKILQENSLKGFFAPKMHHHIVDKNKIFSEFSEFFLNTFPIP